MRRIAGLFRDLRSDLPEDLPGVRAASCAAPHRLPFSRCHSDLPPPLLALLPSSWIASFSLAVAGCIFFLHLEPPRSSPSRATRFFLPLPSSAARSRADRLLSFVGADPARGGRSAGRRTFSPVALARRDNRACETRAVPRDRDGASRRSAVAIFGPRPTRRHLRQCPPDARRALPAAGPQGPAGGVPNLPRLAVRAAAGGRHSPLRLQDVSGDAPHERGYAVSSIGAPRSQ